MPFWFYNHKRSAVMERHNSLFAVTLYDNGAVSETTYFHEHVYAMVPIIRHLT